MQLRHKSLPKIDLEQDMGGLFRFGLQARPLLEDAWDNRTAYQGIKLKPDDVPSRGQCGVSSVWIARQLSRAGVRALFTEGKINLGNMAEDHVWVEVHDIIEEPLILDLTSDQYQHILGTSLHVGRYGHDMGIAYEPLEHFEPFAVPRKKLIGRYALLEQNIDQLTRPWWQRFR